MKNQTVLITGASRGIGRALAQRFAECNKVIAVARDSEALGALAQHPNIEPICADLAIREQVSRLITSIKQNWPQLSVLVNNAAVQQTLNFQEDISGKAIDYEIDINLRSALRLSCELLPLLQRQSQSWIVNMTSVLAVSPKQSTPVYNASKAALRIFTQSLRYQLQTSSVKVVEVIPPITATTLGEAGKQTNAVTPGWVAEQVLKQLARNQLEITIGKARLGMWLHRWFPKLLFNMLIKQ